MMVYQRLFVRTLKELKVFHQILMSLYFLKIFVGYDARNADNAKDSAQERIGNMHWCRCVEMFFNTDQQQNSKNTGHILCDILNLNGYSKTCRSHIFYGSWQFRINHWKKNPVIAFFILLHFNLAFAMSSVLHKIMFMV